MCFKYIAKKIVYLKPYIQPLINYILPKRAQKAEYTGLIYFSLSGMQKNSTVYKEGKNFMTRLLKP